MTALRLVVLVVLVAVVSAMSSCTDVVITGKIAVKGSEPMTWLALSTAAGIDYKLAGELCRELESKYQNLTVTLRVRVLSDKPELDYVAEVLLLEIMAVSERD